MISDDERREVVKRLRNGGVARDPEEAYTLLLWCVGIRPQLPATSTYDDAMVRLADLIDRPTCHDVGGGYEFRCSACGCVIHIFRDGGFFGEDDSAMTVGGDSLYAPHYCPNCGAEVVE